MSDCPTICVYEASIKYRRLGRQRAPAISSPDAVIAYMEGAFDEDPTVEWFFVILLNRKHRPMARAIITRGTAKATLVEPREALRPAVIANASAIVAVHNHPSGDPGPSSQDRRVTKLLREAATVMGIELLDHVIIGDVGADPLGKGYYSFAEAEEL